MIQQSKYYLSSTLAVMLGNFASLINGVVIGFLIPKILSVEGYGYCKTFALYGTYLGLCHLGIIDGIVLRFGAYDYEALPRRELRRYWRWYLFVNWGFFLLLVLLALGSQDKDLRFIGLALALNLLLTNGMVFCQQISEFTQRFRELSIRKTLHSLVGIGCATILAVLYWRGYVIDYRVYLALTLGNNGIFLAWYLFTYRDILWGEAERIGENLPKLRGILKNGFPLLISGMCSTLLLTLDRQFVNLLYDAAVYARYAFAYNLLSLINVATSAVSAVLYPYLKRASDRESSAVFSGLVYAGLGLVFTGGGLFFPLRGIVGWFLPKYREAMLFFRIIYPALALNSVITVIFQNYYKAEEMYLEYFRKSVMILAAAIGANAAAYALFRSPEAVSVASVVVSVLWYWCTGRRLEELYPFCVYGTLGCWVFSTVVFYWTTGFANALLGGIVYAVCFCAIAVIVIRKRS